jgi:tryptophan 6-halogenase
MTNKKSIIVVGGGTAGWMAAGYLSKKGFPVTLVESPIVGIIGVGESTLPAINWLANEMGMQEHEWMPLANATYKLGIKHTDWHKPNSERYNYFLYDRNKHKDQHRYLTSNDLPPRELLEYGYHVDAHKFGEAICKTVAQRNGCKHIVAHVKGVLGDDSVGVQGIILDDGTKLEADFYVDCTGFKKLLAKTVGMKYQVYTDHLNDRAIAGPQPSLPTINKITTTKARSAGWLWELPLAHRRGTGYVYSSAHISDDEAVAEYCREYPGTDVSKLLQLKFTAEVCTTHIKNNVGAAGLSGGFLEPLEATSLFMTFFQIRQIHKYLSGEREPEVLNRNVKRVFDHNAKFILANYTLTYRTDNEYWRYYYNLEKKLDTLSMAKELASQPDSHRWQETTLFFPYSWWALLDGYELLK